jgi:glyoxylase-like metal-dependent hydrolase (beta-lactamase superfamily II)
MDSLWGELAPVPRDAMTTLRGGEQIDVGGRRFDVAYTPGHATHHVSYFSADTGVAFVGDTAGVRTVDGGFVLPPTPPPDIDLEIWRDSLTTIDRWRPQTLLITHYGDVTSPGAHLSEMRDHLDLVGRLSRMSLEMEGDDADREAWYVDQIRRELRRHLGEVDAVTYEISGRFDVNWRGLARYWRKRS